MLVKIKVNGKLIQDDVQPQTLLLDWLRDHGCYSVKRGCDTANCGLCTVWKDGKRLLEGRHCDCKTYRIKEGTEFVCNGAFSKDAWEEDRKSVV